METAISWTDYTWNPMHGCSRVSAGCDHCYAERLSLERGWTSLPWVGQNAAANIRLRPDKLREPLKYKAGSRCFVNSMSDLFHPLVPSEYIGDVMAVIASRPDVTFQALTKRPERAATWAGGWPANIWMGTSVEDARVRGRIDAIRRCGASIRFLSCEPLLGPLHELDLTGIDWVIVGGESGPGFRPMDMAWAREIRDQCVSAGVPFFFKQDAAYRTETRCYIVEADGRHTVWQQYPQAPSALPVVDLSISAA